MSADLRQYENREAASRACAAALLRGLRRRLRSHSTAALALSGGSTPVRCFNLLSAAALCWRRVRVTLTDERCVPASHTDSNQRMLRAELLRGAAAAARFVPLTESAFAELPEPFAAVLLGMGSDGHIASLFPDFPGLAAALDPEGSAVLTSGGTSASPHRRVSLTLARLLRSEQIALLAFGADKRALIDEPGNLPVAQVLQQQHTPVTVFWAP